MGSWLFDPVLRAPLFGSLFLCIAASLMGALAFLKKRSLLGEALSHAAYPGVVVGALVAAFMGADPFLYVLVGAFGFSLCGLMLLDWLEGKAKVKSDAALCYLLSSFFGLGVLLVSFLQSAFPLFAHQAQIYLYGQVATMTDMHIVLYAALAGIVLLFLLLSFPLLRAVLFDGEYVRVAQVRSRALSLIQFVLFLGSIVVGIRSVGVVLMSGMLIAPAVAARACSDRFSLFLILSGVFGAVSGLVGAIFSIATSLPTGPVIVCVATMFALCSLLFAPKRGVVARGLRICAFRLRCLEENVLKRIWRKGEVSYHDLRSAERSLLAPFLLGRMRRQGWIEGDKRHVRLSPEGTRRAVQVVRLHRLWETYLVDLGWPLEKVHRTAEEMEHILTPEFEERLAHLLRHPKQDPHAQPIPEKV